MQGVGGGKGPRHPLEHIQTGGVRRRRRKGSQAVQSLAPAQLCNPVVAILRVKLTGRIVLGEMLLQVSFWIPSPILKVRNSTFNWAWSQCKLRLLLK